VQVVLKHFWRTSVLRFGFATVQVVWKHSKAARSSELLFTTLLWFGKKQAAQLCLGLVSPP
jgi:hypothetical protein